MEATEQRKLRAKQIEMQRREQSRATRGQMPRTPAYPTYTPPVQAATVDPMDSYAAEKNRSSFKFVQDLDFILASANPCADLLRQAVKVCSWGKRQAGPCMTRSGESFQKSPISL